MGDRLFKLVCQHCAGNWLYSHVTAAILRILRGETPQHHLRVVSKIAVDRDIVRGQPKVYPIRLNVNRVVSFLQEDDVGYHARSGVGHKCIVRETNGAQQLRPLREIFAHVRAFGIHRKAARDKGHDASRTHLVKRFGKEIVVDVKAQLVIGLVRHPVIPERHISHCNVIEVPPVRSLKARYGNVSIRIELSGNTPCNGVQLHTIEFASLHGIRQHTEEIADAHRRLQNVPFLKAHLCQRIVDSPDDRGRSVVGIERGCSGSGIFFLCQSCPQFPVFICPTGFALIESVCKATPAHELGQNLLFLRRSIAPLSLQPLQSVDGIHICPEFGFRTAFTKMVVCDTEVGCRNRDRFLLLRLLDAQFLDDHIKGKSVAVAGIIAYSLGSDFRRSLCFRCCLCIANKIRIS